MALQGIYSWYFSLLICGQGDAFILDTRLYKFLITPILCYRLALEDEWAKVHGRLRIWSLI